MTKNILLILFSSLFYISDCHAQSYTIGLHGQAKSTWLINTAVLGANVAQEAKPSFGWGGGITANLYFQQQIETYIGIGIEVNFGNFVQRYSGRVNNSPTLSTYHSKLNLLYIDVPLYAKLVLRYGTYIETGVQFSMLVNAGYISTGGLETKSDISAKFNPFYYAPLAGIGADFEVTDDIFVIAGIRLIYGISDISGVDGQGAALKGNPDYAGAKTHAAYGALNLGVYYRFDYGKFGRAGKGRRR